MVPRGQQPAAAGAHQPRRFEGPADGQHVDGDSEARGRWRAVPLRGLEPRHARGTANGDDRHVECEL